MNLSGKCVLVTGATGFIGGRLAERLVLQEGVHVRALVRDLNHASWLGRFPVEMVKGDIMNTESVRQACAGCDIVFHCAHSASGDFDRDRQVNVGGVENVLRAGLATSVDRIVHISTMSVMGPVLPRGVNETWSCKPIGDSYADTKLEGELLALRYASEFQIPVVVVRPPIVYGPCGRAWTIGPINSIKQDRQVLINGGHGVCNTLYVENLVDALLLCAKVNGVEGEVFLVTDDQVVTWRGFLGSYADWLGVRLPSMSAWAAHAEATLMTLSERMSRSLIERIFWEEEPHIRQGGVSLVRLALFGGKMRLTHNYVDMVTRQGLFDITKAKEVLGYRPRVSFQEGMALTRLWLSGQGFLPPKSVGAQSLF
jgi:nucleoside-diphosphate-sugar epimerase